MNEQLQAYARRTILQGLALLPDEWQRTFKLMYGRDRGKRSVADAVAMPIADIVALVPEDNLDLAMQQVEASLKKISKNRIGPDEAALIQEQRIQNTIDRL